MSYKFFTVSIGKFAEFPKSRPKHFEDLSDFIQVYV